MIYIDYYNEIKHELLNNEITKKVKDYSKNRSDLETYYNVGKLLSKAGKHYGENIIKEYSLKLSSDLGKQYSETSLKYMRKFYRFSKSHSVSDKLTYTHYKTLFSIKDSNKIEYYIATAIKYNLSVRELSKKIRIKEYERLPEQTKNNLISSKQIAIVDFIKNPIFIRNRNNTEIISEKILQKIIIEDITSFLKELGNGFTFIDNEYKIKIGDRYNYIDLLLFNIEYNCYVVVELKVTELKKDHIGQIEIYMNYIDKNIKKIYHDKTIGIIICKRDNKFIMEYCSDERIIARKYELKEL